MIHPNCSELVIEIGCDDLENVKEILRFIMEHTNSRLYVDDFIYTYSDTPLAEKYKIRDIIYPISLDCLIVSGDGLTVPRSVLPPDLQEIARDLGLLSLSLRRKKAHVSINKYSPFLQLYISDGERDSFELFAEIARLLNIKPHPEDGGNIEYFYAWCKKHGYQDLIKTEYF